MTAATLTHLPLAAGGAVLASAGRAALWVIARFMRAPITNSAIAALVGMSLMAGSNALFGQRNEHPAPLFGVMEPALVDPSVEVVIPATRPKKVKALTVAPVVKLPSPAAVEGPIGNKEVFEIQRKLEMLQIFTGTVDGYYGPQTARAIRKFEERSGLKPRGELSQEIFELIRRAPLSMAEPTRAPAVEMAPAPAAVVPPALGAAPVVEAASAIEAAPAENVIAPQSLAALQPLPEPEPLSMEIQTGSVDAATTLGTAVLGRVLPDTPQEALDMAVETAGDAIDTIIAGVQTVAMTRPGKTPAVQPYVASEAKVAALAEALPAPREVAALPALPKAGVPLKLVEIAPKPNQPVAVLEGDARPEDLMPAFSVTDPVIVAKVQRGLGSLGFLHGPSDGVAGEATAKAIRNFEVYFNYKVSGRITAELLDLLMQNGASI